MHRIITQKTKKQSLKHLYFLLPVLALILISYEGEAQTTLTVVPNQANTGNNSTTYVTTEYTFSNQSINWKINNWNPSTLQVRGNSTTLTSNFYFSNTSAISGNISKITITRNAGSLVASNCYLLVGTTERTGTSGGVAGTMNGNNVEWTVTGSNTYFKIYFVNGATSGTTTITNIIIGYTATATPTLGISPTSLTGFSYSMGSGPSSAQTFTASGSNLTANATISAASTDYEVSLTGNTGDFAASKTIIQSGGSISQTVYVRLKAGLSAGNYNNESITLSSTNSEATSKTVTVSGSVTEPTGTFEKITSLTGLTDGDYVIVGNSTSALSNVINGNYLTVTTVSPSSDIINNPDASIIWAIATNNSNKTIYNAAANKYIQYGGTSTDLALITIPADNKDKWTISVQSSLFRISNVSDITRGLIYRSSGVNPVRFAGYTLNNVDNIVYHDLTLYKKQHTVTFNANGGSGSMSPQTSAPAIALTANSFTNPSYTFTGWNTAQNGSGTAYADGAVYNFAADITLYAQWTPAIFRTKTAGNFSNSAIWQYNDYGTHYIDATQVPSSINNIVVFNRLTLDQDFTVGSSKTFTLDPALSAYDTFNIAAGKILTVAGTANFNGKPVTLKSSAAGTASIGQGTAITNATNVTVERYIPANSTRAWRLLSVPVSGSQSINASWQENQSAGSSSLSGLGVWITSKVAGATGLGYDAQTPGNSMLKYNAASNIWEGVTTNTTTTPIATDNGYLLYIRGDRTATSGNSLITATTLRTTGTLKQGPQPAFSVPANTLATGNYMLIGNPYASAIDITLLTKTGGSTSAPFYVWDPKLGTLGGYQTLTKSGANYIISPGGGSYGASGTVMNTIESGQAFFVGGTTSAGTVQITEAAKVSGSNLVFKTTAAVVQTKKQLASYLYLGQDAKAILLDGTLQYFDDSYADAVDKNDSRKLSNFSENLGISRDSFRLAVERRTLKSSDTIYLYLSNLQQKGYRFKFIASKLGLAGRKAYLEDAYLGTSRTILLNDTTIVNFTVDANAGSSASNRFRIVFKTSSSLSGTSADGISIDVKGMRVYPNPSTNGSIGLVLKGQQPGRYVAELYSVSGKKLLTKVIEHGGGDAVQNITYGKSAGSGSYMLIVTGPDKTRTELNVLIVK